MIKYFYSNDGYMGYSCDKCGYRKGEVIDDHGGVGRKYIEVRKCKICGYEQNFHSLSL